MRKKSNIKDLFLYILLFLILILIIVYIFFNKLNNKYRNKKDLFSNAVNLPTECDTLNTSTPYHGEINFDTNFYELTSEIPVFLNINKQKPNYALGGTNLCIYKLNSSGNRVDDIECITSGELQNALSLPKFRRENVCIDEECLNIDDTYILHGEKDFQIKVRGNEMPTFANKSSIDCLSRDVEAAQSCGGYNIQDGLPILKYKKCFEGNNKASKTKFKFDKSNLTKDRIDEIGIDVQEDPTLMEEDIQSLPEVAATHT